jgi:hypothetical protein
MQILFIHTFRSENFELDSHYVWGEEEVCCVDLWIDFVSITGWSVRGSNPGGGEISRTCPDRPGGHPSRLYNGYRVFPGSKATGVRTDIRSIAKRLKNCVMSCGV